MSKTRRKETTLTINFVDVEHSDENMSKLMELIGAPDFGSTPEMCGWDITAPNGKFVHVSSSEIRDFIADTMFNAVINMVMKDKYEFDMYANRKFIEKTYFNSADNRNPYSELSGIWGNCIEIRTIGNSATKSVLDNLHKRNVLALKDKIVLMKHVQNVEYTCRLRDVSEVECSV